MNTIDNPVIPGVASDPSVCRVGGDFFRATSSFGLCRGNGSPGSLMLSAPTPRHHASRFCLACTNVADDQGNVIVSTDDPVGAWSGASWVDTDAFGPSLLFADGTRYYTRRTLAPRPDGRLGPTVRAEIDPSTGELLGPPRELTPGHVGFCSIDVEGPPLYRIGEWYYLFSAEGT